MPSSTSSPSCDEAFLVENGIIKGAMNLIDTDRAELLYARMGPAHRGVGRQRRQHRRGRRQPSAAAPPSSARCRMTSSATSTPTTSAPRASPSTRSRSTGQPPTARSMIFVTPDGERSMNTYLGACVELGPEDVEADKASGAKVTYFEGYLWDPPRAKEAIRLTAAPRPRGRARSVDDAVGPVLRRPLPRRVPRPDALGHSRHRLCQQPRDQVALPDGVFRDGA